MYRKTGKKGFTLVELIIVIAIIGILSAVLIPTITGYIDKAKLSNDQTDVGNMNKILSTTLGIEIENIDALEAPDIRAIINEKANGIYNFIPRTAKDGYHFFYNKSKQRIELINIKDLFDNSGLFGISVFAAEGETGETIEEFVSGLLFLDKSGSDLANLITSYRSIRTLDEYNKLETKTFSPNGPINSIFPSEQRELMQSHFEKFNPQTTLFISDFSFFTGSGRAERIVFADGILSIPSPKPTERKITELPAKVTIPYSVKFIEEATFSSVTTSTKVFFFNLSKIRLGGESINDVFSQTLINTNSILTNEFFLSRKMENKRLGDRIEVNLVFDDPVSVTDETSSITYKPFTVSVNPQITLANGNKVLSSSAKFDYIEDDNGKITVKVKLFDDEGIVGEKSLTYFSPKNLQMSLNGYTLQFENIASAFGSGNDNKLTYYIKIGNSTEIAIPASVMSGIRFDYFFGNNPLFAPLETIPTEKVFTGTLDAFNKLSSSAKEQYWFYPTETDILIGDVGGESEITYIDRKRIEKYFTKSEIVLGDYFFHNGKLFLSEDQRGFNQNITITEERLQATNPGYDIKSTEINILEFHIQKNYTVEIYKLLSNLFNQDGNSIDVQVKAVYDGNEVISKRVTFGNVPETLVKKSLYDGDDIAGQNLTNFEYKYEIDNSFYRIPSLTDVSDYITDAYLEDYYENALDDTSEMVHKIKLRTKGSADKQIDLVYIIRDFDINLSGSGTFFLEVSTGYHKDNEDKLVKDNPSISLAIEYIPIELDYTFEDVKSLNIERINNRNIYSGNGTTPDNPFIFYVGEVISPTSYTVFAPENGVSTTATSTNFVVSGLNTNNADDTVQKATITYIHNGIVRYAMTDFYYIVVDEQQANSVKINGREYINGQDFLLFEGEKITFNGSVTSIDYLLGGNVIAATLNSTSLNWDSVAGKAYYFNSSDNYKKTYRTSAYPVVDFEVWINNVKYDIDLTTSQVNYAFTEGEIGTIKIKYITKVFYPDPNTPGSYIVTSDAVYVASVPYRVVSKRTIEENETINALQINNRSYYQGSTFEFSDGEKIIYGNGTYLSYFNAYNTTSTIFNLLVDFTHDGISNPLTPNMTFAISSSKSGPYTPININDYEFTYDGGLVKYLKVEAKQFGIIHTCIIPFTVLNDGSDPEATKLIPRLINGIIYTGSPIEVKQNSVLGNNALTQMYYKSRNSTSSYGTFNASSSSMKFSFSPNGPFVIGSELKFTQSVGSTVTVYVEYLSYNIRYTGKILFKVVSTVSSSNNSYINTINGRSVPVNGIFTFYFNETLRLYDYGVEKGWNYYPDYFSMVYRLGNTNTTLYEHSNSNLTTRVNFVYEILGNDGNYHLIDPDYQFGKIYDGSHKYAPLSGITNGTFRMSYLDPVTKSIICSANVSYTVKVVDIVYINNRTILPNDVFELTANELTELTPVIGFTLVSSSSTVTYKGQSINYFNVSTKYTKLNIQTNISVFGSVMVTVNPITKKFILNATPNDADSVEVEVPYEIIPGEVDYVEVDGTVSYQAIKNKTFAYMINNRYHKYDTLFEFTQNEIISLTDSSFRIYLEREPNELGISTLYPRSYSSYYSISLYDGDTLVPVDEFQYVTKEIIKNYHFVNGTKGVLTIDTPYNTIYYRTEVEFIVIPQTISAEIHRLNGVNYYDRNATVMIEKNSTIVFNDSEIRYWYANGYYSPVTLTSEGEFKYFIKPLGESDFIELEFVNKEPRLTSALPYFDDEGDSGQIKITYIKYDIHYEAVFNYQVYELNFNPQIIQINGRAIHAVDSEHPFIFVNGEQLFTKNASGAYTNNSNSIITYNNTTGKMIKTTFNLPDAKYAYYVIPHNVDISSLRLGEYVYIEMEDGTVLDGVESDYLEYYRISNDYRFTNDNSNYQKGILRVVHTPSGLGSLTIDIPYEVTNLESQLFLSKISILSADELSERITTNITEDTIIYVLQGQKIKSNSNTQLLFKFAGQTEGSYLYASSANVEFYLVDQNNNETPFTLTTSTATGSTFTDALGTTGLIRIKYTLYGVTSYVDVKYQVVNV